MPSGKERGGENRIWQARRAAEVNKNVSCVSSQTRICQPTGVEAQPPLLSSFLSVLPLPALTSPRWVQIDSRAKEKWRRGEQES